MGILIALAAWQPVFDRWNRSDTGILSELAGRVAAQERPAPRRTGPGIFLLFAFIAAAASLLANWVSGLLPEIPGMVSRYAWMIICVSLMGIALSLTPARGLGERGATPAGYYILYFVLTSIGARASIDRFSGMLVFIAAGFLIVAVHAAFMLAAARLIRAPLFLAATASQANIGGVASAPVVAAMYQPGLASVGLLLAILGNILGTYLGIITGQLCKFIK
jgi:uncharacterized membrane protein